MNFLVDPVASSVSDIGSKARPRGKCPPLYQLTLHKCPRPVADYRRRYPRLEHRLHKLYGGWHRAQLVGIRHPAGQHQSVVISGIRLTDGPIGGEDVTFVQMIESLNVAFLRSKQFGSTSRVDHRLPRSR